MQLAQLLAEGGIAGNNFIELNMPFLVLLFVGRGADGLFWLLFLLWHKL